MAKDSSLEFDSYTGTEQSGFMGNVVELLDAQECYIPPTEHLVNTGGIWTSILWCTY
jgi:hypothetical protein